MKFRKRLLKRNQRLVDSSEQLVPHQEEGSKLINTINNQKLYMKLVGITLSLSKEAGVSPETLNELENKLLACKGLNEFPMLTNSSQIEIDARKVKSRGNKSKHYMKNKKFMQPKQQCIFVKEIQRQVEEISTKEQLVLALKNYVNKQKKVSDGKFIKSDIVSRKKRFESKTSKLSEKKSLNKKYFYGKNISDILQKLSTSRDQSYEIIGKMIHLKTFWGHSFFQEAEEQYCPVYNAIFDNTQRLILTGGEDGLIKVWGRQNGLLLTTLRGHSGFINKFCVSKCNKYLLSAAQDGVRFFDMQSMTAMGGLGISYVFDIGEIQNDEDPENFYIMFADQSRVYLLDKNTMQTHRNRALSLNDFKLFNFKHKITGQNINMNTFLVNPDKYVFMGFTTGQILIFNFNQLEKAVLGSTFKESLDVEADEHLHKIIYEGSQFILPVINLINAHEDEIIEIKWNPLFSCFSTGSKKDGSCRIWQFKLHENPKPVLVRELKIPKNKIKRKKKVYACNFLCWNCTYSHLVCSFMEEGQQEENEYRGDGQVLVYSTQNFDITWQMSKSIDLASITCIDTHPTYENIALICDSYGKLLLVDIFENFIINMFEERAYHLGHPNFCLVPAECRFSQDGYSFVIATEYGNVSLYGYDIKDFYNVNPVEQFFETDYENFEINPISFNPVLSLESNIDINELSRGELCNLRKQPYGNDKQFNIKELIGPKLLKLQHINFPHFNSKSILLILEAMREYERNMEVYRQPIQQIETKRLSILYDEREERAQKVKSYIQEKTKNMRDYDAQFIQRFSGTAPVHPILPSDQPDNPVMETRNRGRGRGRGRGRLRNLSRVTPVQRNQSDEQIEQQSLNNQSEEYEAESQFQQNDQEEEDIDNFDDQYDGNQSDPVYMHRNRSRRYMSNGNNMRNQRRSQRNVGNRNRYGMYQIDDDDEPRISAGIRRKRNVNAEIQDLLNEVEGYPRKRNLEEQEHVQESVKPLRNLHHRRNISEHNSNIIIELDTCSLCLEDKVCQKCQKCQVKKFCQNCRPFRMKKHAGYDSNYHENNYICFSCFFKENTREQCKKNSTHDKYILNSRDIEMSDGKKGYMLVPQIDDELAYFPEGYEEFVQEKIETLNNKVLNMGIVGIEDQSFEIYPHDQPALENLRKVSKCIVREIKYLFPLNEGSTGISYSGNRRANRGSGPANRNRSNNTASSQNQQEILMFIRLQALDGENSQQFWVFYLPGYDYLLKWEIYEDIIKNSRYSKIQMFQIAQLQGGEEIQFMEIKPFNQIIYPSSIWKNIIIHKGESKNLRKSKEHNEEIPVNIWSIKGFVSDSAFQYRTILSQQTKQKYINEIRKLEKNEADAWNIFSYFVDTTQFPMYYEYVEVGMCLSLILQRLQSNYYRSEESFMKDMRHMTENSICFNGEKGYITELCQNIVHDILFGNHYDKIEQKLNGEQTEKKTKFKSRLSSGRSKKQSPNHVVEAQQNGHEMKVKISKFDPKNGFSDEEYQESSESGNEEYDKSDDQSQNWNKKPKKKKGTGKNKKGVVESDIRSRMKNTRIKKRITVIQSDSQDFGDKNNSYRHKPPGKKQDEDCGISTRRRLRNQDKKQVNLQQPEAEGNRVTRSKKRT